MMKKLLNFSVIATLTLGTIPAFAQGSAPIFVQKYKQPSVTSNIPTVVTASSGEQRSTQSWSEPRTYKLVDSPSPFAGTNFGKITSEIDYYDSETGQRYNQYQYMALLAKRGDTQKLNQVGNYLQLNGVFNNQQYQSAVNNAAQGNSIPSLIDEAMAKNKMASLNQSQQNGQATNTARQSTTSRPRTVVKQTETYAPKRLHQGYDEDMNDDSTTTKSNAPIFLR